MSRSFKQTYFVKLGAYLNESLTRYEYIEPLDNGFFKFAEDCCWSRSDENKDSSWRRPIYNIKELDNINIMEYVPPKVHYEYNQDYSPPPSPKRSYRFALFLNEKQITGYDFRNYELRTERKNVCACRRNEYDDINELQCIYNELKEFRNETMWNMLQNMVQSTTQSIQETSSTQQVESSSS